jgi:hypothetical protein
MGGVHAGGEQTLGAPRCAQGLFAGRPALHSKSCTPRSSHSETAQLWNAKPQVNPHTAPGTEAEFATPAR